MDEDGFDYTYWQYDADAETRFASLEEAIERREHYNRYGNGGKIRQYWVKELDA